MTLAEHIAKEKILKKDFAKLHGISDQTLSLWIKWDYIVKDGMIYKPRMELVMKLEGDKNV